jgi:hypothetical protein
MTEKITINPVKKDAIPIVRGRFQPVEVSTAPENRLTQTVHSRAPIPHGPYGGDPSVVRGALDPYGNLRQGVVDQLRTVERPEGAHETVVIGAVAVEHVVPGPEIPHQ